MRCPKCHYISFDSGERCRNCGYQFALVPDQSSAELSLRGDEPLGPLAELSLQSPSSETVDPDLPLFGRPASLADEAPLIAPPAAPRPPLAVRRTTPDPARSRARAVRRRPAEAPTLDVTNGVLPGFGTSPTPAAANLHAAPPGRRLLAAGVDALLLGAIDLAVLYFTLQLCGLTASELNVVPVVPLVAFLLILDGGYVVSLTTAGGQTLGKMLTGLQVVTAAGERVGFGPAVSRAGAYLVSALPAGLGFLPALLGGDRRALHDRLADTRVVIIEN